MMLTSQQFERTCRLALRLAGIQLVERHQELLERRSRRIGVLDGAGLDALLDAAEGGDVRAGQRLLGLVTTKHTGFFRHPRHFDIAAQHLLRAVSERGAARAWSAAAATGEEPYSLAMRLLELTGGDDSPVKILGTDISEEALELGRVGEYGELALRALDPERRARFFAPGGRQRWRVLPAVRRLVEFRALNLAFPAWPVEGPFDVIFCRNVVMYLEASRRPAVWEALASCLPADGLLLVDPAEHLGSTAGLFTAFADGVFARRSSSCPARNLTNQACPSELLTSLL